MLVGGNPGSGKSTLARRIADRDALWLPLISADAIGMGMVERSWREAGEAGLENYGRRKVALFRGAIDHLVDAGVSLVAELSFRRGLDERWLEPLGERARLVYVYCHVPVEDASQRFCAREAEPMPARDAAYGLDGLLERMSTERFVTAMRAGEFDWSPFQPMDLDAPRLDVDTRDGYKPELEEIIRFCRQAAL